MKVVSNETEFQILKKGVFAFRGLNCKCILCVSALIFHFLIIVLLFTLFQKRNLTETKRLYG